MLTKNQNSNTIKGVGFTIEISDNSGFCFGVVNAISKAEEVLSEGKPLYCVGEIVHNDQEIKRLEQKGLKIISREEIDGLKDKKIIFRAHGEPQKSYDSVKYGNNQLIDATCPVVLKIQDRINKSSQDATVTNSQIVIFGKKDHPEVIAFLDKSQDRGIIVENINDLNEVDFLKPIELFSQTTMSITEYREIAAEIKKKGKKRVKINDTICRQVACRVDKLKEFSKEKDIVFFVGGKNSSNAKVLFNNCKEVNRNTFFIESEKDIDSEWLVNKKNIGICGATSTPQWLMQKVMLAVEKQKLKIVGH